LRLELMEPCSIEAILFFLNPRARTRESPSREAQHFALRTRGHIMNADEVRYCLLKLLESNPDMTQRDLARELGVSVGKAHYVLRALIERGMVKASNFRSSGNKKVYLYQLTPIGFVEKAQMARRFLAAKLREYDAIQRQIAELQEEIASNRNCIHGVDDP
jgi:MarR family transcriptional regulator, temperature-dependent positive regulator of motility